MKEIGAQWLVDMAEYISSNPLSGASSISILGLFPSRVARSKNPLTINCGQSAPEESETDDEEENAAVDFIV